MEVAMKEATLTVMAYGGFIGVGMKEPRSRPTAAKDQKSGHQRQTRSVLPVTKANRGA